MPERVAAQESSALGRRSVLSASLPNAYSRRRHDLYFEVTHAICVTACKSLTEVPMSFTPAPPPHTPPQGTRICVASGYARDVVSRTCTPGQTEHVQYTIRHQGHTSGVLAGQPGAATASEYRPVRRASRGVYSPATRRTANKGRRSVHVRRASGRQRLVDDSVK